MRVAMLKALGCNQGLSQITVQALEWCAYSTVVAGYIIGHRARF